MEFVRIESKCREDINVILRCEYCGKEEMVYGYDTDAWYKEVEFKRCSNCHNSSQDEVKEEI